MAVCLLGKCIYPLPRHSDLLGALAPKREGGREDSAQDPSLYCGLSQVVGHIGLLPLSNSGRSGPYETGAQSNSKLELGC